ncbi:MAG: ADP-glyceromanno-heptose 6-epimerase [Pseudomonadota bacterium]
MWKKNKTRVKNSMIVVTGGAGFIGSRLVVALNAKGHDNILVVDDLTDGRKFSNLIGLQIADYWDISEWRTRLADGTLPNISVIFHEGACSETTEWDGKYLMDNNYRFTKELINYAVEHKIPCFYASSAAVYGMTHHCRESDVDQEKPLNAYGYSKWLVDCYVRRNYLPKRAKLSSAVPLVGFRYFNVFGPHESHKGKMASVMYHWWVAHQQGKPLTLFGAWDGYKEGEQSRDFIYVEDVVKIILWSWENSLRSGIYNLGTGVSTTFNTMARAFCDAVGAENIQYVPFPDHLKGRYQSYTCADMTALAKAGCPYQAEAPDKALHHYIEWLKKQPVV